MQIIGAHTSKIALQTSLKTSFVEWCFKYNGFDVFLKSNWIFRAFSILFYFWACWKSTRQAKLITTHLFFRPCKPFQPILHQGSHELFGPLGILGPFGPLEPLGSQGPHGPKSTLFSSTQSCLSIKLGKG